MVQFVCPRVPGRCGRDRGSGAGARRQFYVGWVDESVTGAVEQGRDGSSTGSERCQVERR